MSFYKIILRYKGTQYQGWQKQPHTSQTIQGQLEKALKKISKSDEIHTIGSGRTDSGVHALGQVVRVQIPLELGPLSLLKALNSHLPNDIECIHSENSSELFNPVFDAKDKTYKYLFSLSGRRNALVDDSMTCLDRPMDIEKMREACELFIGEHDFADFYTVGTDISSTVRVIYDCKLHLEKQQGFLGEVYPEHYIFEVKGSGFLKQMVRLMVGTLWNIGLGKVELADLKMALSSPSGAKLAAVAPSNGLYLCEVNY
ncbi:tRNA pseudouridine(38-40) synthase TruA [Halobacteriovorax marinus]|uniref:tRNA pseudouridine(38-40) synthase TruA n=1 Tax=Halobacteriovorax marinus TaxID=97084 RepID=UPI003A94DB51